MKKINLVILFSLSICFLSAQDWRQAAFEENSNYFDIIDSKKNELSTIRNSKQREDRKKVKQFERWAYFWERRINDDGSFPSPMKTYNEWNKYQKTQTNQKNVLAGDWTIFGPTVIPESTVGFYAGMGRLNVVTFNPTNTDEIWVGSPGGGIWRSNDAGANWIPKGDDIPNLGVSDIVFDPTNQNVMYLATGDFDGAQNNSIGVLKSTDHGETWVPTGLNYDVTQIRRIAHLLIDPNNTSTIFATTSLGIYKSTDGGINWALKSAAVGFNDILYKEGSATTMFATESGSTKFYISTDNGENWTESSTGLTSARKLDIALTAADPEVILAMNNSSVFKSTDGGASWGSLPSPSTLSTQGGYNQTILVAPNNKNLIIIGGVDGWRSTNGGFTWQKYMDGYWEAGQPFFYVHSDHHDLEFLPGSNTEVFSANDGGLFKGDITSDNAWTDLSSGLAITQYYKLAGTPQNSNLILAGAQDNDVTHYDGTNWNNRNYGSDGVEALWNYSDSNIAWSCSQAGGMERTTDGWATTPRFISTPSGANFVWPLEISPTNPDIIYGGFNSLYKSVDRGDTWTSLNSPGSSPRVITIAPSNDQIIYTSNGSGLYRTINGGITWNMLTLPVGGSVTSIAVNSSVPEEVYICYGRYNDGNKVFKSTDSGSSWTNISGTLPNLPANKILYLTGGNGDLFLGTDVGVFHRNNGTTDWQVIGRGLPNVIVNDLEVHYGTEKLRAATYGRGIWEINITTEVLGVTEFDENVLAIYPNPTEGIFTIQLKDIEGESDITIYNIIGGVVKNFRTRESVIDMNMTGYSSGIYMVQVRNGNKQIVKKLIVK
ncbi:T9SS type A sorting domain-containing protein [Aquimarina sp. 2201CG14-23]|uniref:T9SS type A sorting domain-containing protein n=1 Tax=Aquimarina mycalae TaxID=3040073 RepID=UPI00247815F8|nr:T9SS type A sorting domain-containing protein [Aquimarina sp. 2201CG14-23]MDH7446731.1 T9SS type A sorting domain-containing protein [Aquimarina sp. 2201CG14-23]